MFICDKCEYSIFPHRINAFEGKLKRRINFNPGCYTINKAARFWQLYLFYSGFPKFLFREKERFPFFG